MQPRSSVETHTRVSSCWRSFSTRKAPIAHLFGPTGHVFFFIRGKAIAWLWISPLRLPPTLQSTYTNLSRNACSLCCLVFLPLLDFYHSFFFLSSFLFAFLASFVPYLPVFPCFFSSRRFVSQVKCLGLHVFLRLLEFPHQVVIGISADVKRSRGDHEPHF